MKGITCKPFSCSQHLSMPHFGIAAWWSMHNAHARVGLWGKGKGKIEGQEEEEEEATQHQQQLQQRQQQYQGTQQ